MVKYALWMSHFKITCIFVRLLALEEQYRKEKEEADMLFEQQRKVSWENRWYLWHICPASTQPTICGIHI